MRDACLSVGTSGHANARSITSHIRNRHSAHMTQKAGPTPTQAWATAAIGSARNPHIMFVRCWLSGETDGHTVVVSIRVREATGRSRRAGLQTPSGTVAFLTVAYADVYGVQSTCTQHSAKAGRDEG
ncbi:hypothetical protein M409DRAFT_58274 [Zasmidium cellare ATCC 36951]|uniref:Uncharacterized protein n=1 Tax=Zasmidium cellare ATCC 36951 TaxID=1080233 RepID=A0A6A6C6Q3_ZASCE|nr:uncharacterized protein M409DRAFT_58274 [Zasmidium cellare ATCC 36951]KAF2162523.1 hypothetical protein M409DRAFT_58274 [Zasmidium cellare ATCC 36951]